MTESLETAIDPGSGSVLARRRRRLGALVLDGPHRTARPPARAGELLAQAVAQDMTLLPWSDAAPPAAGPCHPHGRPGTRHLAGTFSDPALAADVQDWLAPALAMAGRLPALDVAAALRTRLGYRLATRLDQALPAALDLPAGHAPVDYTQPVPVAAARAQAFFGLARQRPAWPTAASPCSSRCSPPRRPPDRHHRRHTPASGAAAGPKCVARCAAAIPSHAWPEKPRLRKARAPPWTRSRETPEYP